MKKRNVKNFNAKHSSNWVDKNYKYIIEGMFVTYTFLIFSTAVYSIGLNKKDFDAIYFFQRTFCITIIFFAFLSLSLILFTMFSKLKSDILYLFTLIALSVLLFLYVLFFKNEYWLNGEYLVDIVLGIWIAYYRIKNKVNIHKEKHIGLVNINSLLTVLIPALATLGAALIKK